MSPPIKTLVAPNQQTGPPPLVTRRHDVNGSLQSHHVSNNVSDNLMAYQLYMTKHHKVVSNNVITAAMAVTT